VLSFLERLEVVGVCCDCVMWTGTGTAAVLCGGLSLVVWDLALLCGLSGLWWMRRGRWRLEGGRRMMEGGRRMMDCGGERLEEEDVLIGSVWRGSRLWEE